MLFPKPFMIVIMKNTKQSHARQYDIHNSTIVMIDNVDQVCFALLCIFYFIICFVFVVFFSSVIFVLFKDKTV